jgi:uncharacterized protein (TIGR02284 family)
MKHSIKQILLIMETNNNKLIETLNDLLKINNDRIAGYEKAADEAKRMDIDLQGVFAKMADESRRHAAELKQEIRKLGGEPANGTTNSGKIYRLWMDIKATFSGKDRHAILEACEFGEDAAQKAYTEAIDSGFEKEDVLKLIKAQQAELKIGHNLIKRYRDMNRITVQTK